MGGARQGRLRGVDLLLPLLPDVDSDWLVDGLRWLLLATLVGTAGLSVNALLAMLVGYQGTEWRSEHRLRWGDVDDQMWPTRPGVERWPMEGPSLPSHIGVPTPLPTRFRLGRWRIVRG